MPEKFQPGVVLHDGTICKSAILEPLGKTNAKVTITEGKYHQIKRMFGVYNLGVNKLHRVSVGALVLPQDLKSGECCEISAQELKSVFGKEI